MGDRPVSCEADMVLQSTLRGLRTLALSVIAGVAISAPAQSDAGPHFAGGGYHAGAVFHGGYGFRGGYGFHGGFGWGWRGGCCWWGWPGAFWLGALPLYYSTWWWGGVPYYYAYDNYYIWNPSVSQYQLTSPPSGLIAGGAPAPGGQPANAAGSDLFAYPKNGQTAEQQARDKQECRAWAATQSGASADGSAAGAIASAAPQNSEASLRAEAACLEGRGYSVK
jgi:hypothetical protein